MRFSCTIDGLEANWIEFSDVWTRNEGVDLLTRNNEEAVNAYLAKKCVACYVEQLDGPAVTDPKQLTWEWLGDIDVRIHRFIIRALFSAYSESVSLGNGSAQLSSSFVGMIPAPNLPH